GEDEALFPKVQPRRGCEERGATEEGNEESPCARLASPAERGQPERRERDGQVRGGQDRAERAPEIRHSPRERHLGSICVGIGESPEPEIAEGARKEHEQTERRERRQRARHEGGAGGKPLGDGARFAEEDVQNGEQQESAAALFQKESGAEEQTAAENHWNASMVDRVQEDEHAREHRREDEMFGVSGGEEQSRAQRERREGRGGDRRDG